MNNMKNMNSLEIAVAKYEDAVDLLRGGMPLEAMLSVRHTLAAAAQHMCIEHGLEVGDPDRWVPLLMMIDALHRADVISDQEAASLHVVRGICNKAVHAFDDPIDLSSAQNAVILLSSVFNFLHKNA